MGPIVKAVTACILEAEAYEALWPDPPLPGMMNLWRVDLDKIEENLATAMYRNSVPELPPLGW